MLSDNYTIRRLRLCVIFLGLALACTMALLLAGMYLAKQSLLTHYNLYYLMWKQDFRRYEAPVALSGIFHDHKFRKSLIGITVSEFQSRFPSTFYEVRKLPPIAKDGQQYFIDNYERSIRENGALGLVWLAVFENGRLVEFDFSKG